MLDPILLNAIFGYNFRFLFCKTFHDQNLKKAGSTTAELQITCENCFRSNVDSGDQEDARPDEEPELYDDQGEVDANRLSAAVAPTAVMTGSERDTVATPKSSRVSSVASHERPPKKKSQRFYRPFMSAPTDSKARESMKGPKNANQSLDLKNQIRDSIARVRYFMKTILC